MSTSWSSARSSTLVRRDQNGRIIPVEITVYEDRSFTFITKTPPAAVLIKEALAIEKGSGEPNRNKVGLLTQDQLRQIAEVKMPDLNARDVDQAMLVVAGTARSMGVEVEGLTMDRGEYEAFVLESERAAAAEAEREAAVAAVRAAARAAAAEVEEARRRQGSLRRRPRRNLPSNIRGWL